MSMDIEARDLAIQAKAAAARRQPRLSIVSGAGQHFALGPRTVTTVGNYDTMRVRHKNLTGGAVGGLRLLFCNYGSASARERPNANAIVIKTAIEFEGTASDQSRPRTGAFFGGAQTLTLTRAATMAASETTKPFPGVLAKDAVFYERTGVTVTTAGDIYQTGHALRGGTAGFGIDTGEGVQANSAGERVFDGGDVGVGTGSGYSASAVLGTCIDGGVARSIAILGDSITAGVDDAAYAAGIGGWVLRAFAEVPHVYLPFPGEKLSEVIVRSNAYTRFEIAGYATHVLFAYGRNDLGALRTAAQIKADMLTAAQQYMLRGQVFIAPTILPAPSSSDGWFSVAGQTKESTEGVRVAVNQWLRDGGAGGFRAQANAQMAGIAGAGPAKICDPCRLIECDASGALATDGGYVLGAAGGTQASGTASAANTTSLTDAGKAWAINAFKGKSLFTAGGTGAGQSRCIGYNTATTLGLAQAWTTLPDATSVYTIFDAIGMTTSVHPHTRGCVLAAAGIDVAALMG